MVNILRKEQAKRYINDLADKVRYRRSMARYATAKVMYEMLTGEEYTGGLLK